MIGIYLIENTKNNKKYIGHSIDIERRLNEHRLRHQNENDYQYESLLYQDMRNFPNYFKTTILETFEVYNFEELKNMEQKWIRHYNTFHPNGYNLTRPVKNELCVDCGAVIDVDATRCIKCAQLNSRIVERPDKKTLIKLIYENGFEKTGRMYGVSGNAIKKWCKSYGLPHLKKEIIELYNSNKTSW